MAETAHETETGTVDPAAGETADGQNVEPTQAEPTPQPQAAQASGTSRFPLPAGKVTPIGLKNALVQQGKAPADIKPQMFYTFVKNPGKNDPFPVKHYDAAGKEYDTPMVQGTVTITRPGLDLEAGVAWWDRRRARSTQAATTTEGTATAGAPATAPPAEVAAAQATEPEGDNTEFNEAE
jgi:hypothetical protein